MNQIDWTWPSEALEGHTRYVSHNWDKVCSLYFKVGVFAAPRMWDWVWTMDEEVEARTKVRRRVRNRWTRHDS